MLLLEFKERDWDVGVTGKDMPRALLERSGPTRWRGGPTRGAERADSLAERADAKAKRERGAGVEEKGIALLVLQFAHVLTDVYFSPESEARTSPESDARPDPGCAVRFSSESDA